MLFATLHHMLCSVFYRELFHCSYFRHLTVNGRFYNMIVRTSYQRQIVTQIRHTHTHTHTHARDDDTHKHTHTEIHTYTHTRMHIHTQHTRLYIHTHKHTHTSYEEIIYLKQMSWPSYTIIF